MTIPGIAQQLLDALDRGATIASIVARNPGFGWEDGYRVAAALLKLRRARGERTIGRKIGFTNRSIWPEYGATAPICAHVYDRTVITANHDRAVLSLSGAVRPRLEPEIAFKLKAPLAAGVADPARILECIEWVSASFEIVDCHFNDWKFQPGESVADFSLHWRLIVGTPHPIHAAEIPALAGQLRDCRVTLSRNGEIRDRGVGANALGHPAAALVHLAAVLATQPQFEPLAAGEIVTTGTLTAALPVAAGERWVSDYAGLPVTGLELTLTA